MQELVNVRMRLVVVKDCVHREYKLWVDLRESINDTLFMWTEGGDREHRNDRKGDNTAVT